MITKYYVDQQGKYLGGFVGAEPPAGSIEVAEPPLNGADVWDGDRFVPPPPISVEPLPRRLTVLAFRNRFTKSEKVRIELAAIDDPAAGQAERERAAIVRIGQADLLAATYVDVEREETRADVAAFEAMGLLDAPGRALVILDEPIQPHEQL